MQHARRPLMLASTLALAALTQGTWGTDAGTAGALQPYAELAEGRYLDAGELSSGPAPAPGTVRSERWERACELGLETLIASPEGRRGAYDDHGAVHSAWSSRVVR
jgi:hypothetical protein